MRVTSPVQPLTYSMDQSPSWETNQLTGSQEIPRILCNPKVHYRINVPTIFPYPKPDRYSPRPHTPIPEDPS